MQDRFIKRITAVVLAVVMSTSLCSCSLLLPWELPWKLPWQSGSTQDDSGSGKPGDGKTESGQSGSDKPAGGGSGSGKTGSQGSGKYTPARWKDSNLKQVMEMSPNVTHRDDFNLAVNREWSKANKMPDGYDSYDLFVERQLQVNEELLSLMKDKTPYDDPELEHDRQITQNYYELWLDWDTRNALGMKPIKDLMAPLLEVDTLEEMTEYLGREETAVSASELANCYALTDWNDTDHYAVYIDCMGLVFGDSMYYQMMDYGDWKSEPFYDTLIRHIIVGMGFSNAEATEILIGAFAFEKDVAEFCMTTEENSAEDAAQKQNNIMTVEEMDEIAGDFPIREILGAFGALGSDTYILCEPDWLEAMSHLYTEDNLEKIRDYLLVYTAQDYATLLDRETYELYGDVLNSIHGASGRIPDEQAAVEAVDKFLPDQLGHLYTARHVQEKTIKEVTDVTEEILEYYEEMLAGETFLSEDTRKEAIRKLKTIRLHIAAPQKWEDDSRLSVSGPGEGGNLFKAQDEIGGFLIAQQKEKINGTVDHSIWTASPQSVNAYYDPTENSVTICAGILGGSFYNTEMTREQLLATVGDTIAHEISHAFDSSGCHFDEKGNLRDWWKQQDYIAFRNRADKLVEYYDNIMPLEGVYCSGILLQAEAIADLVAMKTMLQIAAKEAGFDYRQFFETFAGTWRNISTVEKEYYSILQDNHPLAYLRTNAVVQQFQEFYDTYGIREGDGMYLAPEDRLEVW